MPRLVFKEEPENAGWLYAELDERSELVDSDIDYSDDHGRAVLHVSLTLELREWLRENVAEWSSEANGGELTLWIKGQNDAFATTMRWG